ncbi:uncharacterized protein LOC128241037 [Mya arenaria]|uniref:uncharacterized protein LOC128241037 n=1 Tax=Mya arenaria TaxID=6604 RepID=UPI0022E5E02D|nr:uncharacterized protein LOC128241037 [Mya arenaria]
MVTKLCTSMSDDNSHSDNSIARQLRDISNKLSQQSDEVSALREEFRGNSVSIGKEVKKLKTDIDVQWKRQGNKVQYTFNAEIIDFMSQACWALENDKVSYCKDVLSEGIDKLKHRQKLIRIADSSEGGWDTVNCYESNPLASDSDDETKLRKAETQALKKRKNKSVKRLQSVRKTPSATVTSGALYGYPAFRGFQPDAYRQQAPRGRGSFRGFYGNAPRPSLPFGSCYSCGEYDHFRRQCPYTTGAAVFKADASATKK